MGNARRGPRGGERGPQGGGRGRDLVSFCARNISAVVVTRSDEQYSRDTTEHKFISGAPHFDEEQNYA